MLIPPIRLALADWLSDLPLAAKDRRMDATTTQPMITAAPPLSMEQESCDRHLTKREYVAEVDIQIMTNCRFVQIAIVATATSTIVSLAPRPAQAIATFTGNGLGFAIPDNNATGEFSDIAVADNFLISDITVSLNNISTNYIGDLIATLTHIDTNTTVDLFRRVGQITTGSGDSSNLKGTYRFNDSFTGDLWAVAGSLGDSSNISGGDYFPTGAANAAKAPMLTTIGGLSSSGTWRLRISDNRTGNLAALTGWTLNLQGSDPTPVPGPLPLLGAGAAFGWSRRLRKRCRAAL